MRYCAICDAPADATLVVELRDKEPQRVALCEEHAVSLMRFVLVGVEDAPSWWSEVRS